MKMSPPFENPAERRNFPRKEIHARLQGQRLNSAKVPQPDTHLSLALRDLSLGGLSAISEFPLPAGQRIAIFFPPQGPNRGWDAYGKILRCDQSSLGYRVAVEFDPFPTVTAMAA